MNLSNFTKKGFVEECKTFFSATLIALLAFGSTYAYTAYSANPEVETLTVTIAAAVTFQVDTNVFGTLTPGTPKFATSTTQVTTNATAWNISLYGNNTGSTTASTTLYSATTPYSPNIPDGVQWSPSAALATTSAANAVTITSGDDFLYFRVMSASGTYPFRSTTWWGTDDTPFTNAKWAGIASSTATFTVGRRIGSVTNYQSSIFINTVQYYLDVSASQQQDNYTGNLTYTWVSSA